VSWRVAVIGLLGITLAGAATSAGAAPGLARIAFVTDRAPTLLRTVHYGVSVLGKGRRRLGADPSGLVAVSADARRELVERLVADDSSSLRFPALFVRDRRGGTETRLTPPGIVSAAGDWGAEFSPGGKRIVFTASSPPCNEAHCGESHVYVAQTSGAGLRDLGPGTAPTWSPDGRLIAYGGHPDFNNDAEEIDVVRADGTGLRTIGRTLRAAPGIAPLWAPRGRRLAYFGAAGPWSVEIADAAGHRRLVTRGRPGNLRWSEDGRMLAFDRSDDRGLSIVHADGHGLRTIRRASPGAADVPLAWSHDDSELVVAHGARSDLAQLFVVRASDGRLVRKLTNEPHLTQFSKVGWSPNGRTIRYAAYLPANDTELATIDSDGTTLRVLTHDSLDEEAPDVSPDGKRIVFAQDDGHYSWLATIRVDGTGLRRLTVCGLGTDEDPVWSPDGTTIAFVRHTTGAGTLEVMNADGSGQHAVSALRVVGSRISWSPDGRRLAFGAFTTAFEVFTIGVDGTGLRQVTHTGLAFAPRFSPDGSRLLMDVASGRNNHNDLAVVNSDGTDLHRVAFETVFQDGGDWSPDGSRIVFARQEEDSAAGELVTAAADGGDERVITSTRVRNISPSWRP
jgi:Tol biopolymer transport system component